MWTVENKKKTLAAQSCPELALLTTWVKNSCLGQARRAITPHNLNTGSDGLIAFMFVNNALITLAGQQIF